MIAQRNFDKRISGQKDTLLGPHGILEGMDIHTAGEAIVELKKKIDRQSEVIAILNAREMIE